MMSQPQPPLDASETGEGQDGLDNEVSLSISASRPRHRIESAKKARVGFREPQQRWSEERADPRNDLKGLSIHELRGILGELKETIRRHNREIERPGAAEHGSEVNEALLGELSRLQSENAYLQGHTIPTLQLDGARDLHQHLSEVVTVMEQKRALGHTADSQEPAPPALPPRTGPTASGNGGEDGDQGRPQPASSRAPGGGRGHPQPTAPAPQDKGTGRSSGSGSGGGSGSGSGGSGGGGGGSGSGSGSGGMGGQARGSTQSTTDTQGQSGDTDTGCGHGTHAPVQDHTAMDPEAPPVPPRPPPRAAPPIPPRDSTDDTTTTTTIPVAGTSTNPFDSDSDSDSDGDGDGDAPRSTNPFGDDCDTTAAAAAADDDDDRAVSTQPLVLARSSDFVYPTFRRSVSQRFQAGSSSRVFGVYLGMAVERSALPGDTIPCIVRRCLECLRDSGLKEEGLYRLCGSAAEISRLRLTFESGADVPRISDVCKDIHVVTGLLKAFLRDLPNIPTFAETNNVQDLLYAFKTMEHEYYHLFHHLVQHWYQVHHASAATKMTADNLAICLCPTLRIPAVTLTTMIVNFPHLFHGGEDHSPSENDNGT